MDVLRDFVNRMGRAFQTSLASFEGGVLPAVDDSFDALVPFEIPFPGGTAPLAVRVRPSDSPAAVLSALGIVSRGPALAVMGGAGLMDTESMFAARSTIEDGLVAFAAHNNLILVDGGTASGTMALIGVARQRRSHTFPLIGVAPRGRVAYPGFDNPTKDAMLDGFHSHFALVQADAWGGESDMLAGLAAEAGQQSGWRQPVLGVIINGGGIVAREAHARATGPIRFPLLVMEGSGRFADELATAWKAGRSDKPEVQAILDQGEVYVQSINGEPERLRNWLGSFFGL